ncbi:hypothetical protein J3E68DRAFT_249043 [Trichoderma sp. SZMC 28012]
MHPMYVSIHVMCLVSQWILLGAIGLLLLGVRLSVSPDCNIDALDVALGLAGSAVTFKHQALLLCLVRPWYRLRKGKRGPSIQPFGDGYFRCLLLPVSSLSLWQAVIRIWGPLSHLTSSTQQKALPCLFRTVVPLPLWRRVGEAPTGPRIPQKSGDIMDEMLLTHTRILQVQAFYCAAIVDRDARVQ